MGFKIGVNRSQSLVKAIVVAFYESIKNSEDGDTNLVEAIIAETFLETK